MAALANLLLCLLLTAFSNAAPPLFESEKIQLTNADIRALSPACKVYSKDPDWPSEDAWTALDELVHGSLLQPRPQAAPCYPDPEYNAEGCAAMTAKWTNSHTHFDDPLEMMSPVYQGLTCVPPNIYDSKGCTQGGLPLYIINATTPKHVKAGVNSARNTGEIEYLEEYVDEVEGYAGPAFKCGTGVQAFEIYKAAHEKCRVVVGGEGETVGVMGGYIQGAGHSPLISLYGTGADQVLAFEVVTPDGRFVTADSTQNTDLFWAMRGGGGSTFGVATSVTIKAYPDMPVTVSRFSFSTANMSNETFWGGVRAYFDYFIPNADAGTYSYFLLLPNVTNLGIRFDPNITHYPSFYPAWHSSFPLEVVSKVNVTSGSRLSPRANFEDPELLNKTFSNIKLSSQTNHFIVGFNMKNICPSNPSNAVNPAWRQNVFFSLQSVRWSLNATAAQILEARKEFSYGTMQRWRDITPGAGSYLAESDRLEPEFQQSFYGDKYERLLEIKKRYDPLDVFWAATSVGSEFWAVDSVDGLPKENGKLCRVQG
ncbi:FAD binding domain-containing protein [Pseudomassariella vexata]|uniref:FAD binding domain-containing protein n=1 Tax=Pseudomassariella vexata TaxID=1141098 RepID=A0A1Y2DZ10_9PEZI|nr:FAD binding domain-containing protein [Pseudomassariella vexata]ORY63875.1 FAD binding domain-containing protein [Pseudomassariella vexata]